MSVLATSETSFLEIRQHNAITNARYEMSACEMDIVFSLLSVLRKEDTPGHIYRIRVKELEQLTGRVWNYQRLLEGTSNLRSREYHIEDNKHVLQVGLVASALYVKGEGTIELEVSERMRPYLIDLKSNFTSYRLHAAFSLSSKYAKRIYQLASQWKDIGETKTFLLSEFKTMLSLKDPKGKEPEQYEKISAFQKYVLDVATAQINEHTDLRIITQALNNLPEGPYHADAPHYYLPTKPDVYKNMEALIYHFKIVMGEIDAPVGEVYHSVEGGNGELGFYLVSDGGRTPYRLHFRRPCFIYYQAYPEMAVGTTLSDAIVILSSMNVIAGELDA